MVLFFPLGPCRYASSSKSFIFSLYNINGCVPVQLQLKSGDHYTAIFGCSNRGPSFGRGHDITISYDNGRKGVSFTSCGSTYPLPPGYSSSGTVCAFYVGGYEFTPTDVEGLYETVIKDKQTIYCGSEAS